MDFFADFYLRYQVCRFAQLEAEGRIEHFFECGRPNTKNKSEVEIKITPAPHTDLIGCAR
jgi:hypothetical protein